MQMNLTVNGTEISKEAEPRVLLVHFIRDDLGLPGPPRGRCTSNLRTSRRLRGGPPGEARPVLRPPGGGDEVLDPAATEGLARRATVAGHRLIVYPGYCHEPYNDNGRERVFADLAAWLTD